MRNTDSGRNAGSDQNAEDSRKLAAWFAARRRWWDSELSRLLTHSQSQRAARAAIHDRQVHASQPASEHLTRHTARRTA